MTTITALVLAGGRSSRMGQDKALLSVQGLPLLRRICEAALQCTSAVYVVTPWPQRYQTLVPEPCQFIAEHDYFTQAAIAEETGTSQGPLLGFAQALPQITTEWVLLLACDLPGLQGAILQQWAIELPTVPETAIAFLPQHAKGWEPLCGFYHRRCWQSLQPFIHQGGRSFQSWLAQQTVQPLSVSDPSLLWNCNTPADFAQLRRE